MRGCGFAFEDCRLRRNDFQGEAGELRRTRERRKSLAG